MAHRMPKEAGRLSIVEELRELKELTNQTLLEGSQELRREGLRRFLEYSMLEERERYLKAGWYKRNEGRTGYAAGYYTRDLLTEQGLIERLRVPRARDGKFRPEAVRRYKRRSQRIDTLIRSMFLNGVSTRDVNEVLEDCVGVGVSATTVSCLAAEIDADVRVFHRRALDDEYEYLLLDGIVLKSREFGKGKKRIVLTAVGIRKDGRRELIDFLPADSEGEVEWTTLLNDLYQRGLKGRYLKLITTDGAPGLTLALVAVYPRVAHQRCWAHKLRNVSNKLPKRYRDVCVMEAGAIYSASCKTEAVKRFWQWAKSWRSRAPKAVQCIEKDLRPLLQFFSAPKTLWKTVRTTNIIERAFKEVRKRTKPIGCFNNDRSIERFAYGVTLKLNRRWTKKHQRCPNPLFAQKS